MPAILSQELLILLFESQEPISGLVNAGRQEGRQGWGERGGGREGKGRIRGGLSEGRGQKKDLDRRWG